jgi:hypothetical protein
LSTSDPLALGVAAPAPGAVEIERADSSPPALVGRLGALPTLGGSPGPANASVEKPIRQIPAANRENLGMRFTFHVIDERRYGELARTRNSLD